MCGIVGYIGGREAVPILIEGLKNLEYRGYDSAGIAVADSDKVFMVKRSGKLKNLEAAINESGISGSLGIGHTRWATHGAPTEANAHPHFGKTREFFVVHNGIIENHQQLKESLKREKCRFNSETDTEVIVHLLEKFYTGDLKQAVCRTVKKLKGSFALGVISSRHPDLLLAARRDSPLIIGLGKGENYIASDVPAILSQTRSVIYLENDEIAVLGRDNAEVFTVNGDCCNRRPVTVKMDPDSASKGGYSHFMIKEINEQPEVMRRILSARIKNNRVRFEELKLNEKRLKNIDNIQIVACGTAYHAGLCGKYVLEKLLKIPVNVDTSSEFRYREQIIKKNKTLVITVSQSGETADTLAALRASQQKGALILSVVNVVGSSIARESDGVVYIYAGPEIAVASTKAYTAQLMTIYLLALYLGEVFGTVSERIRREMLRMLARTPLKMKEVLANNGRIKRVARDYVKRYNIRLAEQFKFLEDEVAQFKDSRKALEFAEQWARRSHLTYGRRFGDFPFLYLGRNVNFPSALEGALKLKEITYISAEGYAAGEMKHGPIALIDEFPLVICINPRSSLYDKMLSNIQEIKARRGTVLSIATKGDREIRKKAYSDYIIEIPPVNEFVSPLIVALPLQLLAYYIAAGIGCDIDQPRNLAKSVTVE